MLTFRLAELAPSKKARVKLSPISDSIGAEKEYLRTLRAMLRKLATVVRTSILPEAERELAARRADLTQDAMGDNSFEQLRIVSEALQRTSEAMAARIVELEAGRHTDKWKASVRAALGIDIATVVRQEDLSEYLQSAVARNAALIRSLSSDTVQRVERATYDAILQGRTAKQLRSQLTHEFGVLDSRAKLIARDQVSSLNADLNEIRHRQAGIDRYIWSTSNDERVRPRHRDIDGIEYEYGKPTGAEDGLPPGRPINCRCVAQPIVVFPDVEEEEPAPQAETAAPDFGVTNPDELARHKEYFDGAPDIIRRVIAATGPLSRVEEWNANSEYMPGAKVISMELRPSDQKETYGLIWRHEYGHHVDYERAPQGFRTVSLAVADRIEKDAKALEARLKAATSVYNIIESMDAISDVPEAGKRAAIRKELGNILKGTGIEADDILNLDKRWQENEKPPSMSLFRIAHRLKAGAFVEALEELQGHGDVNQKWTVNVLADMLGAATRNKIGWGHNDAYYMQSPPGPNSKVVSESQATEVMANYMALVGGNRAQDRAAENIARALMPDTMKALDSVMEELGKE